MQISSDTSAAMLAQMEGGDIVNYQVHHCLIVDGVGEKRGKWGKEKKGIVLIRIRQYYDIFIAFSSTLTNFD